MFEEAADDGAHFDPFGDAGYARPQAAHAAHDEVDTHAGSRRAVQRLDDGGLGERVELGNDARGSACARVSALPLDPLEQRLMQAERRMQQLAQTRNAGEPGQLQEYLVNVLADRLV